MVWCFRWLSYDLCLVKVGQFNTANLFSFQMGVGVCMDSTVIRRGKLHSLLSYFKSR